MRRKESEQIRFTVQWKTLDFGDSVTFFHKAFQKGEIQVIEILIQLFGCLLPNFSEWIDVLLPKRKWPCANERSFESCSPEQSEALSMNTMPANKQDRTPHIIYTASFHKGYITFKTLTLHEQLIIISNRKLRYTWEKLKDIWLSSKLPFWKPTKSTRKVTNIRYKRNTLKHWECFHARLSIKSKPDKNKGYPVWEQIKMGYFEEQWLSSLQIYILTF